MFTKDVSAWLVIPPWKPFNAKKLSAYLRKVNKIDVCHICNFNL